jgi:hypothetical protein
MDEEIHHPRSTYHLKESRNEESSPESTSTVSEPRPATGKAITTKATIEPPLRILKIARCPTVSGKSTLTYHLGCTPESVIKVRLYGNTGNGFLNQDWIAWTAIQEKLELHSPFTSQVLHALFSGKSLNSPGFLMAVLKAEGVVKASTVKGRCYELTKDSGFLAEIERLMASGVELDADTEGRGEARSAAKAKPKKQAGEAEATTEAPADVDSST